MTDKVDALSVKCPTCCAPEKASCMYTGNDGVEYWGFIDPHLSRLELAAAREAQKGRGDDE